MVLGLVEILLALALLTGLAAAALRRRRSAPPNGVLVVHGRRSDQHGYSIVRGATPIFPVIELGEPFSLEPIEISTRGAGRSVLAVVRFPEPAALYRTFDRLGLRPRAEIAELASDAVRAAVTRSDRLDEAQRVAREALDRIGLELETLSIAPERPG